MGDPRAPAARCYARTRHDARAPPRTNPERRHEGTAPSGVGPAEDNTPLTTLYSPMPLPSNRSLSMPS